jgi:hypothetical protein
MSFDLNYWLKETIDIEDFLGMSICYQKVRPRIICQDGYSVSVQASEHMYCEPRYTQWQNEDGWNVINGNNWLSSDTPSNFETDHFTPYESVELGFPSEADDLIYEYAEGNDYTSTVYGYVPVKIVEQLIEKHGGFKEVDESNVKDYI